MVIYDVEFTYYNKDGNKDYGKSKSTSSSKGSIDRIATRYIGKDYKKYQTWDNKNKKGFVKKVKGKYEKSLIINISR